MTSHSSKVNTSERRRANRDTGLALAAAGIPIVPTKDKAPVPIEWPKLDSTMTDDERAAAAGAFREKHGFDPLHVGSTLDPNIIREWTTSRDFTPSVSLGAAGLVVLDLDMKDGVDGVALGLEWLEQNGVDITNCPRTRSQNGGLHVYFSNPDGVGCGRLKARQWDLKGVGGQVVAAGATREDGKSYTLEPGAPPLADAYRDGTIPPIPPALVDLFKNRQAAPVDSNVSHIEERPLTERLRNEPWPDPSTLFDPVLGFDLDALAEKDPEFRRLITQRRSKIDIDKRDDSASGNRWNLSKCLIREFGDAFDVLSLAAAYEYANDLTDGAFGLHTGDRAPSAEGREYDNRQIAREWLKHAKRNMREINDGTAFGVVEGEVGNDNSDAPLEYIDAKEDKERKKKGVVIKGLADFCAEYQPVEYVADEIVERGKLYTLTARTGHGKTSVLSSLALAIATGRHDVLGLEVERGRVVYCTFENPDDFRVKLMAAMHAHKIEANDASLLEIVDLWAEPEAIFRKLQQAESDNPYTAVIGDTLQAGFQGADSNSNDELKKYIQRYRLFRRLKGRPATIVAAHPVKNAEKDNLVPYGGGALLNEIDGNLCLWKEGRSSVVQMHHQGKFRGMDFAPQYFQLEGVSTPALLDAKGRELVLPVARACAPEQAADREEKAERREGDRQASLLSAMVAKPHASQGDWAVSIGCDRFALRRALQAAAKNGLVEEKGGRWIVKRKGRDLLKEAQAKAETEGARFAVADDDEAL